MEPITGFISTTEEPDSVVPVAPHEAYFNAAKLFMPCAWLLAGVLPSGSAAALTLLSGHILECLLKAFLSNVGVTEEELRKKPLGHDLSALWRRAAEKGLAIGSMPDWAEIITKLHDAPYPLRYLNVKVQNEQNKSNETKYISCVGLPDAQLMMSGIARIIEIVREKIGSQDS